MYFIVSIDTEEDMPNWVPEKITRVENIKALPKFHKLFQKYHVKPTYLVNEPVLQSSLSCQIINGLHGKGDCEIGLHLHSWNTPPIMKEEKKRKATVLNNYSNEIQNQKINNIHNLFVEKLSFSPTSYRAGRYGLTPTTIEMLCKLGYLVDSSVVPLENYSSYGAPDYSECSNDPFWIKAENGCRILELPLSVDLVTIMPKQILNLTNLIPDWLHIKGIMHRLNLARLLWLRPTTYSVSEMKQIIKYIVKNSKIPVLNMMFHSSELSPRMSPYNGSEKEVSAFQNRLEQVMQYVVYELRAECVTMSEFAQIASNGAFDLYPEKQIHL